MDAVVDAIDNKLDALVTGEMTHAMYSIVMESDLQLVALGHYASETPGIVALKDLIAEKFELENIFIDIPTKL